MVVNIAERVRRKKILWSISKMSNLKPLVQHHRVDQVCQAYLEGKTPSVSIGTSAICNLACLYCDRNAGAKSKDELKPEQKLLILKELISKGIETVDFCTEGEPMMDPAFWPMVEMASKRGVLVFTFSNLTQITSLRVAQRLFRHNVSIAGKMDRFGNFDDLVGKKGASAKIKKGLDFLMRAGYPKLIEKENLIETNLGVVFVPTALNFKDIEKVSRFCFRNKIFLRLGELEYVGRGQKNKRQLFLPRAKLDYVYQKASEVLGFDYLKTYRISCFNVLGMFIRANGDVLTDQFGLSCPFVIPRELPKIQEVFIGNVLKEKIDDIWQKIEEQRKKSLPLLKKKVRKLKKETAQCGCAGPARHVLEKAHQLIVQKMN